MKVESRGVEETDQLLAVTGMEMRPLREHIWRK